MATTKRESNLGKEKKGISPPNPSITTGQRRSTSGSSEKQVPNYLRPTISSRNEAPKNAKKAGPEDSSQKPNLLRRRSFDRPPSAARVQKALLSPAREKPTASRSASFSSKPTTSASKVTLERVAKKPSGGKPQSTLSSSRSIKKTTGAAPTAKKGSASSALKKHPSNHDKNEAQNVETKLENEETLDYHQVEEVVKNDQGDQIDDSELTKAEENEHHQDLLESTEVKSAVEDVKDSPDDISRVSQEHNNVMPETDEIEDKHEEESDHTQHDEDKENQGKEEIDVGDHDHQEKIPNEEAKTETEEEEEEEEEGEGKENATEEVPVTKEIGEEKQVESRQDQNDEGRQEEVVEGEAEESKAEAANVVVKSLSQAQAVHGKKESATPYNNVIEETASKLLEERKNKVRALVGAFETVIDKETSNAK